MIHQDVIKIIKMYNLEDILIVNNEENTITCKNLSIDMEENDINGIFGIYGKYYCGDIQFYVDQVRRNVSDGTIDIKDILKDPNDIPPIEVLKLLHLDYFHVTPYNYDI